MTIFEKNMAVLTDRYPELAKMVNSEVRKSYDIVPSTVNSAPNLLYRTEREELLFYNPTDPLSHVKSIFTDLKLEQALFVVLLGLGLGYQLKVLFSAFGHQGPLKKIIMVEKDIECLRCALEVMDLSDVLAHQQVKLIIGSSEKDLYLNMWNAMAPEFGALKAIKLVPWPASIKLDSEYYYNVKMALRDVARSFISERGNDPYDNLVAYENFFDNLSLYMSNPGLHHVKGLFEGRPAIVVAAGPSLNKNVHLLKMLDQRAVILSADASLKVLHEKGISPHFVTTVERTPGTDKFFEGISDLERTVLAVASFTYPQTLISYAGPLLFMHRFYHIYETLKVAEDCFEMGGTTAHCAFALARYMGCNPIIFIGQDLAFGPDGVTHARGCAFGQRQSYAIEADRLEVPANMGGMVQTCSLWLRLLREYERTISNFKGLAINSTEGGAKIQGTQLMTFKEAITLHCTKEFQPREVLLNHLAGKKSSVAPTVMIERFEWLAGEAEQVLKSSRNILENIAPVLRLIEGAGKDIPNELVEPVFQASRTLNRLADELMVAPLFSAVGELFMAIWVPLLIEWQVVTERFMDRTWAEAYRLQLGEEGFGAIAQLCLSLLDVVSKGKKKVEALI